MDQLEADPQENSVNLPAYVDHSHQMNSAAHAVACPHSDMKRRRKLKRKPIAVCGGLWGAAGAAAVTGIGLPVAVLLVVCSSPFFLYSVVTRKTSYKCKACGHVYKSKKRNPVQKHLLRKKPEDAENQTEHIQYSLHSTSQQ
mmetsp:Transcript_1981/g.6251  ORF Transcript_1981/g.6251 Transcript_1981/m.6251 type:complete len:142 (+) Transcript_1981:485-910(+)